MNQPVAYNGVEIQVLSCRLLDDDDWSQIETSYDKDIESVAEAKCLVPEIQIKNTGSQVQKVNLASFSAQSGAWRNGIDMKAFQVMNEDKENLSSTVLPGQTVTMKLPYPMSSVQLGRQSWGTVKQRDFQLVLSLYPVKRTIKLIIKSHI